MNMNQIKVIGYMMLATFSAIMSGVAWYIKEWLLVVGFGAVVLIAGFSWARDIFKKNDE